MEYTINSIAELERFAADFLRTTVANTERATVVGLSGDLGSGKTAFTKVVACALGVSDEILSPTFVLAKFYDIPKHAAWSRLVHIDAYRLEEPIELKALRFDELISDPRNLVFIEWPEQAGALFPADAPKLNFRFVDETTRAISA